MKGTHFQTSGFCIHVSNKWIYEISDAYICKDLMCVLKVWYQATTGSISQFGFRQVSYKGCLYLFATTHMITAAPATC